MKTVIELNQKIAVVINDDGNPQTFRCVNIFPNAHLGNTIGVGAVFMNEKREGKPMSIQMVFGQLKFEELSTQPIESRSIIAVFPNLHLKIKNK